MRYPVKPRCAPSFDRIAQVQDLEAEMQELRPLSQAPGDGRFPIQRFQQFELGAVHRNKSRANGLCFVESGRAVRAHRCD